MRPHGLNKSAAPQSPRVLPADVCPTLRGLQLGLAYGFDRPLRGDELTAADVAEGSVPTVGAEAKQSSAQRNRPAAIEGLLYLV